MGKAKTPRMTARRKLFLRFVKAMRNNFDDVGLLRGSCDTDVLVEELLEIMENSSRGTSGFDRCSALCSALHFWRTSWAGNSVDEFSDASAGGEVFEIAYEVGWSLGFESGKRFAIEEASESESKT